MDGIGSVSASDTEIGLNVGGGVSFPQESVTPSVGAKFEIGGGEDFMLFFSLGIPIGS